MAGFGLCFLRRAGNLVEVDAFVALPDAVADDLEVLARKS